ncbi:MAG: hybrid sensor histidine kinase/response regulator [Nitrospinae bacterium CG11_big_fil_rev_8_21_14_0_20_45_15]|nr:MAG: hybrid sensor histidine kinase/response regulator [Nitrospinae bacterium CG11_big_fil_rev_8_21_14_0_20_45_15]
MKDKITTEKMQLRIDFLEKSARRNLFGLELLNSIGELQLDASMARDQGKIIAIGLSHLKRWMDFKAMGVFMVDEADSEFVLQNSEPEEARSMIQEEINAQIENGTFAWALNLNKPLVVTAGNPSESLILHVLTSKSRVRGMFAALIDQPRKDIEETSLSVLSVILQNTAHSLEGAALYELIYDQNMNLEDTVRLRTQDLELKTIILRDEIVNRKLAEESLIIARDQAEAAARAKSEFLANMSHEIRTPLNAILGFGEILQYECNKINREDLIKDLSSIESAGRHLLSLINDILDISRIQADKMELHIEEVSVRELVQGALETVRFQAEKNRNELKATFGEPLPEMILTDLVRAKQILINLVANACKFTHEGKVEIKVSQIEVMMKPFLSFEILDNGIGILPAKINSLFKEFVQADSSTTRKYGGTGLGLPISKRLCELLGGEINVISELGKGSVFTFTLPIENSAEEDFRKGKSEFSFIYDEVSRELAGEENKILNHDCRDVIVVFEDDPIAQDLMRRLMDREGLHVEIAEDFETGIGFINSLNPIAITLELHGKKMNGWKILESLKDAHHLSQIPIIIISELDDIDQAKKMGADGFFKKPVNWDDLFLFLRSYRSLDKKTQILVVEDDKASRENLRRILNREGWDVLEASNSLNALEIIDQMKPSLILLDLVLPDMDGFDLINKVRSQEGLEQIPALVLSGKELTVAEKRNLQNKVNGVLQKGTYTKNELLATIDQLLKRSNHLVDTPE